MGIIQCGSFTTDGSGNATVNLGWEPQYLMVKGSNAVTAWTVSDASRGFSASVSGTKYLMPNGADAEGTFTGSTLTPTATGFTTSGAFSGALTYIYLAIRRPNKPPTVGTQVYNAIARTGTGANSLQVSGVGFAPDLVCPFFRTGSVQKYWFDRLRGNKWLFSSATSAEGSGSSSDGIVEYQMDGYKQGSNESTWFNQNSFTYIDHFFKRAPGVFDQVCYTGTGVAKTEAHSLGVVPGLMIVKSRSDATGWPVYSEAMSATKYLFLHDNTLAEQTNSSVWNNKAPTASVITIGNNSVVNASTVTYVAYLFASKSGISKVGSYTGNGSSKTINCGFTTGARFVLIRRRNLGGDWYVWDSTRGIVAGNDPHLSLNTAAAEVTTDDSIDPDTSGFIVNQVAATDINVSAATYTFLAFA